MSVPVSELRQALLRLDAAESRPKKVWVETSRIEAALVSGSTNAILPGTAVGNLVVGDGIPVGTTVTIAGTVLSNAATVTGTRTLVIFTRVAGTYNDALVNPKVTQARYQKEPALWELANVEASKPIYRVRVVWSAEMEPLIKLSAKWMLDNSPKKAFEILASRTQNLSWEVLLA